MVGKKIYWKSMSRSEKSLLMPGKCIDICKIEIKINLFEIICILLLFSGRRLTKINYFSRFTYYDNSCKWGGKIE